MTRFAIIETGMALAIVLTAVVAWRTVLAVLPLFVLAIIWPVSDEAWEGKVFVTLSRNHGVTLADMLGPLAIIFGLAVLARWRRR